MSGFERTLISALIVFLAISNYCQIKTSLGFDAKYCCRQ